MDDEPRFVELADGVHTMLSPELMSNCTVIASPEGVLVVDARYTRALAEIRLDGYGDWPNPERLGQAIERAYAELTGPR